MNIKRRKHNNYETEAECDQELESSLPIQLDEYVEDFMIRTRRILVVGEIDEIASAHICTNLQLFSTKKDPVYMYINSPGGCLSSGYAIVDQMLACRCPVYTIVRGQGHSMGAIIAGFGEKGHRYATHNSSIMLHSIIIQSSADSIERYIAMTEYLRADYDKKTKELAKRLKINSRQLVEMMSHTKWMSPTQAIKIGLIDAVWTPKMERSIDKGKK